jgi:Putative auto-transporter adhesin, head GIN domain
MSHDDSFLPALRAGAAPTLTRRGALLGAVCLLLASVSPLASAAQRAFSLTPFSTLELDLPARYVIREAGAASARARGAPEVINRIVFEQHDDRVRVYVPGEISIQGQLVIEIDTVGLNELVITGAGQVQANGFTGSEFSLHQLGAADIDLAGLDVDKLRVEMQGSGKVKASGRATKERMRIAGSGEFHGADLAADSVDIKLEGAASVEVMARERLEVDLSGAGSVRYRGEPKLSTDITGSGTAARM